MDPLFSELSTALSDAQSRLLGTTTGLYALAAMALILATLACVTWLCYSDKVWTTHQGHGLF